MIIQGLLQKKKFEELACTEIFEGDILVSRLPDPVGKACITPNIKKRMITAVDCTIIRFDKTKIIPSFFVYLTLSDNYYKNISQYLTGASRPRISRSNLSKVEIPLPPLEVQKEIVAEIEGYQKIIDGARQIVENWKPTIKIEPTWPMVELGQICKTEYGYTESAKDNGNTRFIRITDIDENGLLKKDGKKYINLTNDSRKYLINPSDLLVARTGATYGKTLHFNSSEQAIFASYLIRLNFDNSRILNKYYWIFTLSEDYQNQKVVLSQGGAQPQFNANSIVKIKIPLPAIETQKKIVSQIESEQEIIEANKKLIAIYERKINDKTAEVWGE